MFKAVLAAVAVMTVATFAPPLAELGGAGLFTAQAFASDAAGVQLVVAQAVDPAGGFSFLDKIMGLFESFPAWLTAITAVVTALTAITTMTPNKSDDKMINAFLKVLNFLAGNFGQNKNAGT